jgi:hypothetical protein
MQVNTWGICDGVPEAAEARQQWYTPITVLAK